MMTLSLPLKTLIIMLTILDRKHCMPHIKSLIVVLSLHSNFVERKATIGMNPAVD